MGRLSCGGPCPGKLKGAAITWARATTGEVDRSRPAEVDEEVSAQFEMLGAKVEATAKADAGDFPVAAENWPTLMLFLALQTQWRVIAGSKGLVWLGFDYSAVESFMRLTKIKRKRRRMAELQEMEGVALTVLNGTQLNERELAWATI